jgi:hypothetical protein
MAEARYIMVGGFLGAGKTTAILRLAEYLTRSGRKVGLISNDQSSGLVDTRLLSSRGFPVEEITGGCFCCRFNSLLEASRRLERTSRPDVFIAEPVGSCTDLRSTVSYPLRRMYGGDFRIAPLTVLLDPLRALRILGLEPGKPFSDKVVYLYQKQLEEAEIIGINKLDLLGEERLLALDRLLCDRFPRAEVLALSARKGIGLDPWFERLETSELASTPPPELDYQLYGEGEALLGWLNCTLGISGKGAFDGNRLLQGLARRIQASLRREKLEVAHLKMVLAPAGGGSDLGVLNLTRGDGSPEMSHLLAEPLESGELVINLRAEGEPDFLRAAVLSALGPALDEGGGLRASVDHLECFSPPQPSPVHRLAGF